MYNLIVCPVDEKKAITDNSHVMSMFDLLISNYGFKFIDLELLLEDNINEYLIENYGELPQHILFNGKSTIMNTIKIDKNVKLSYVIIDIHHQGKIKRERIKSLSRVTNVFATYGYCFNKYHPEDNCNIIFLPHSIRHSLKINENPIKKILVSGRLNQDIYIMRQVAYDLSKKNKLIEYLKPNTNYREDINSDAYKNGIFGEKFIQELNKYLCCFCDDLSEDRPYIVAKVFEILGSGSLLLACNENTKDYFEKLGFVDGDHYISCTKENMLEKIDYVLDPNNEQKINEIRKKGQCFAINNHSYTNRTELVAKVLESNNCDFLKKLEIEGCSKPVYY